MGAANFFVWEPQRALVVALAFLLLLPIGAALTRRRKALFHWSALVGATAWLLFGINEYYAKKNRWNIRVDLLVLWPAIVAGTILCLFFWAKMILKNKQ